MGKKRNAYRVLAGKSGGMGPLIGGWIILKWILERSDRVVSSGLIWLRIETKEAYLWTQWWIFEFHKNIGMFLSSYTTGGLSVRAQLHWITRILLLSYVSHCLLMIKQTGVNVASLAPVREVLVSKFCFTLFSSVCSIKCVSLICIWPLQLNSKFLPIHHSA
jgi:hypothetical protein